MKKITISSLLAIIIISSTCRGMVCDGLAFEMPDPWDEFLEINWKMEKLTIESSGGLFPGFKISAPRTDKLDESFTISVEQLTEHIEKADLLTHEELKVFNEHTMIKKIGLVMHPILKNSILRSIRAPNISRVHPDYRLCMNLLTSKLNSIGGTVEGQTALHIAAQVGLSGKQITKLLKNGANPFIKDKNEKLPIDVAIWPITRGLLRNRMKDGIEKQRAYLQRVLAPKNLPVGSLGFEDPIAQRIAEYRYPMPD